ncbi:ankyrin repeat-containing protein [Penicillium tannophilum]|nr:ankyrin repeat-containing protein [Penicillium tannophilum]
MLLNPFRPCEGSPTYQEEYWNSTYVPTIIETSYGFQIVAPNTPFVAATGLNSLYFIDTRLDHDTAQHIKNQIERATIPIPDEYTAIDEIAATAERKNRKTGETTFVFDPVFARVMFARGINKRNPEIKLPEYGPAGDWLVAYDLDEITGKMNAA